MILSTHWLDKTYQIKTKNAEQLAHNLTMAGLEVDDIKKAAPEFTNVIIAEVIKLTPHPDADKLKIAEVNTGKEKLQIVCGAPNVKEGAKVPLAQIGANLPDGLKIKKSKLRGVESFGMLCSARELGLSDEHTGLLILPEDAPIGEDIRNYLNLDEYLIDIDLTPNRGDCFSLRGLAREIALLSKQKLPENFYPTQGIAPLKAEKNDFPIHNHAPEQCAIYHACLIKGVNNHKKSPLWLTETLRRLGIRTHSPLVDITNYVMLLLGTPMHAFDYNKIDQEIHIRFAKDGESLELINGNKAKLQKNTLVIADRKSPLAIAGVMGGEQSACGKETTNILLESAWFSPLCVAGKAREYNLASDSAQRFERGVDYTLQQSALALATHLILEICGGEIHSTGHTQHEEHLPKRAPILLRQSAITKRIGCQYATNTIEKHLTALGGKNERLDKQTWRYTPPSWRFDLNIEADLIEEIARIEGYENIPNNPPSSTYQKINDSENIAERTLCAFGFQEIITYSFIDHSSHKIFFPEEKAITLQNPISQEMAEMRLSLIPALINTLAYNRHRQNQDLRLFEQGKVFIPQSEKASDCLQIERIAGVLSGKSAPEQWSIKNRLVDYYDGKAVVERLLQGKTIHYKPSEAPYLHPGQSADIYDEAQQKIGVLGTLHPETMRQLGIKGANIIVFELEQNALPKPQTPKIQAITKYPSVRRDLSLVMDKKIPSQALSVIIEETLKDKLQQHFFFDQFTGGNLKDEQKSLSIALILQNKEKTLQDEEVGSMISLLIERLKETYNVELR